MSEYLNPSLSMTAYGVRKQGDVQYGSEKCEITLDGKDAYLSFFGMFNGYHGDEAYQYAKANLKDHILSHDEFWADKDESIFQAIREGFISCQDGMWFDSRTWPRTPLDLPSMSGTSASVVFFTRGKIPSPVIIDRGESHERSRLKPQWWKSNADLVGKVSWPKTQHTGRVTRSGVTLIEEVPFLPVSRSLGDFWSYNFHRRAHIVSPFPDTGAYKIGDDARCIILGNQGLWQLISPQDAVHVASEDSLHVSSTSNTDSISKRIVDYALGRLVTESLQPEIVSAVTIMIHPRSHKE
ncbi:Protein phosphatase 1D [Orchesella cincta]|uniref:Protein phosphatase 1D n=1 Tax=Orchesella cincta TaxID=48709 RepID=A0A1D2NMP8_ORCCI|nr:Protein phosphatase 1D [Orchesella cincta]